jgi:hypothetical protein
LARKFLYFVVFCVVLAVAGTLALRYYGRELAAVAYVPGEKFKPQPPLARNAYDDPAMWFARPGLANNPASWMPATDTNDVAQPQAQPQELAVFFIHPTSYLARGHWNAPLDDKDSQDRARLFLRGMASPFNAAREMWIPRYRQAALGAFLTEDPQAQMALDLAYRDVTQAFASFLKQVPADTPIVIAGHSQGALHVTRLLHDQVAGKPLAARVVAAYPIGWPISTVHDLPQLGLPACASPDQAGCIMAWSSFAEPPEPGELTQAYSESPGLDGQPRGDEPILCTNPLLGQVGGAAPASANLGTLVPNASLSEGTLKPAMVPARCEDGLLLVGPPPELGPYVLPGNNYHVYDIPMFWANLRQDVAKRLATWQATRR